jgi:uncharacterized protein CbrC (UPF0167 family)
MFDAVFTDVSWAPDDVPSDVAEVVLRRTPGFNGWQQERWLHHCRDGAEFLGAVGARELAPFPDVVASLRSDAMRFSWPLDEVESYLAALSRDGQPTAYLFRCRHCRTHLAYSDFT